MLDTGKIAIESQSHWAHSSVLVKIEIIFDDAPVLESVSDQDKGKIPVRKEFLIPFFIFIP